MFSIIVIDASCALSYTVQQRFFVLLLCGFELHALYPSLLFFFYFILNTKVNCASLCLVFQILIKGIKVSSVEIERICNDLPDVIECAAIGVSPPAGGPSILVIFAITPDSASMAPGTSTPDLGLKTQMQKMIKEYLNPLFHVGAVMVRDKLPRTASNKVMRRVLRDEYAAQMSVAPTVVLPNSTPTATR